ncbi:MAG: hypothetical protein GY757_06530, partial [bacterium]|nr:hypothetical protein [bacterium]
MDELNIIEEKFTRCPKCRSFSVKQVEINFNEKIKGFFVPAIGHQCDNCGFRFVDYDSIPATLKNLLITYIDGVERKWLLVVVPLLVVALISLFIFLPDGEQKTIETDNQAGISPPVNQGDVSDKPGTDVVKPGDESGKPGTDVVKPGDESGKPGTDAVKPGDESGKPG